jgi:hypothetical protein
MSESRAVLLQKAAIAALVGSVAGGTAGVWSLRRPSASVNAAAPAVSAASPPPAPLAKPVAPAPQPTQVVANAAAPSVDEAHVLQQARTLAQRPDVMALMALRNDVVRRATERGAAGSSSVKGELDEIDLRLNEARTLQLKLDAEAFRKADSKQLR